jgi:hypothetical protein
LVWSFDKRYPKADYDQFIEKYRRADCLFTLIAERHSRQTDQDAEQHGTAMIGRDTLLPALTALESAKQIALSSFTAQDSSTRYFKNQMGGLGQYYAGTLADLQILEARPKRWITYSKERGGPIALSFDRHVDGDLFWKLCERDTVKMSDLDKMASFCPCCLRADSAEHQELQGLFFARDEYSDQLGEQRRKTFEMLIHLADALQREKHPADLNLYTFRGCVYTGHLPKGSLWKLPPDLEIVRRSWAIYERGDVVSTAFQGLLTASLLEMEAAGRVDDTVESFVLNFMRRQSVLESLKKYSGHTLERAIKRFAKEGPSFGSWSDERHEIQNSVRLVSYRNDPEVQTERLLAAFECLLAVLTRDCEDAPDYEQVGLTSEVLVDYPINLASFRARAKEWINLTVSEVFAKLIQWALHTHLKVALRKLRQTGQSSFRFRPSEMGLEVVEVPHPVHTVPRVNQAIQILRDLGMLCRNKNGLTEPTLLGLSQLEARSV